MHFGQGTGLTKRSIGQKIGEETATLTADQAPSHTHALTAKAVNGDSTDPSGTMLANNKKQLGKTWTDVPAYVNARPTVPLFAGAIGSSGNSEAHENRQPYAVLNLCIALQGIFPPRS